MVYNYQRGYDGSVFIFTSGRSRTIHVVNKDKHEFDKKGKLCFKTNQVSFISEHGCCF